MYFSQGVLNNGEQFTGKFSTVDLDAGVCAVYRSVALKTIISSEGR